MDLGKHFLKLSFYCPNCQERVSTYTSNMETGVLLFLSLFLGILIGRFL